MLIIEHELQVLGRARSQELLLEPIRMILKAYAPGTSLAKDHSASFYHSLEDLSADAGRLLSSELKTLPLLVAAQKYSRLLAQPSLQKRVSTELASRVMKFTVPDRLSPDRANPLEDFLAGRQHEVRVASAISRLDELKLDIQEWQKVRLELKNLREEAKSQLARSFEALLSHLQGLDPALAVGRSFAVGFLGRIKLTQGEESLLFRVAMDQLREKGFGGSLPVKLQQLYEENVHFQPSLAQLNSLVEYFNNLAVANEPH